MKKIIIVMTLLLLGSGVSLQAQNSDEDTMCVKPFFRDTLSLSKEDLVCFLEGDTISLDAYVKQSVYVMALKSFNRNNRVLITNPVEYIKQMKDTLILFDNFDVNMASRGCTNETYFFRTALSGYHRVFTYRGVPKILAKGGYVIESFDDHSFDAYHEAFGQRRYITLTIPQNHPVHQGDVSIN